MPSGVFKGIVDLKDRTDRFLIQHNQNSKPLHLGKRPGQKEASPP
jgi:hypothetical protein